MTRYVCSRCGKIITEEESIQVGEYELICEQCHPSWKDENFEEEEPEKEVVEQTSLGTEPKRKRLWYGIK